MSSGMTNTLIIATSPYGTNMKASQCISMSLPFGSERRLGALTGVVAISGFAVTFPRSGIKSTVGGSFLRPFVFYIRVDSNLGSRSWLL